ncbi:type VI secretion system-associated FHA domain protein TagH [Belnapia sp. T6]|uniref:Type VI secretion system-associated FHA domain protein TagH n=1 Tax=Belnapia mucosa TaxID=2804532 RepID=A0ABS1VAG8_9PROT|nr:type VI secretion system-associated FHA domain protein TagH [Belnapia mucosa]MBL6458655.1 type VI secretion system-associated FHA domain protein TagH [Belnapia mucosa]
MASPDPGAAATWQAAAPVTSLLAIVIEETGERRELAASGTLSVGRARHSDLLLAEPGPNPTASRRHCVFALGPDGASVTDLGSTNGTRVNGTAVVPYEPTPLEGGEVIEIGAHRLAVVLTQRAPQAEAADLVGGDSSADPSAAGTGQAPGWRPPAQDWPEDEAGTGTQASSGGLRGDPLAGAFREALRPLLRGDSGTAAPATPAWPRPGGDAPQHEALVPNLAAAAPRAELADASAAVALQPEGASLGPVTAWHRADPVLEPLVAAEADGPALPEPARDPFGPGPAGGAAAPAGLDRRSAPGEAGWDLPPLADLSSIAPTSPAEREAHCTAVPDSPLLAAFLVGAEQPASLVQGRDPEEFFRDAGRIFAGLADGLRRLLAVRAAVKNYAGLERTQIGPVLNNPLKLSVNGREAAGALLGARGEGYLPPAAAVEASLRDLKAHELGVLDGVQSALEQALGEFSPAALEHRFGSAGGLAALVPGGRRARMWDLYQERYAEVAAAARAHLLGHPSNVFRAAYARAAAAATTLPPPPPPPPGGTASGGGGA